MRQGVWQFDAFLRSVHRRLVIVRTLEATGIGIFIAAIFALLLTAALLWQGREAISVAVVVLIIGAIAGAAGGMMFRRPTFHHAALEADRQLDLADLLATALAARASDDPWQQAVVAVAAQRCAGLNASSVVLHRLGGRAWGGIALSAATVLTLGAMSMLPDSSRAIAKTQPTDDQTVAERADQFDAMSPAGEPGSTPPSQRNAPPERDNDSTQSADAAGPNDGASEARLSELERGRSTGESTGQSDGHTAKDDVPVPTPAVGRGADNASPTGTAAVGGSSSGVTIAGSHTAPGSAAPSAANLPPPPWSLSSWPADVAAAQQAVQRGQIPDPYRDIVREYFRPQPTH